MDFNCHKPSTDNTGHFVEIRIKIAPVVFRSIIVIRTDSRKFSLYFHVFSMKTIYSNVRFKSKWVSGIGLSRKEYENIQYRPPRNTIRRVVSLIIK